MRIAMEEENRKEQMTQLREVFSAIDTSHDGILQEEELNEFLSIKANSVQAARACRVSVRTVKDVMRALSMYGKAVTMEAFVAQLVDAGQPATEKGFLKLEAKFVGMLEKVEADLFQQLEEQKASSALGGKLAEDILAQVRRNQLALESVSQNLSALQASVLRATPAHAALHHGAAPSGKLAANTADGLHRVLEQHHLQMLASVDKLKQEIGNARIDANTLTSRRLEASVARLEANVSALQQLRGGSLPGTPPESASRTPKTEMQHSKHASSWSKHTAVAPQLSTSGHEVAASKHVHR